MNALITFILGLFGIKPPKAAVKSNHNNQPVIVGTTEPVTVVAKSTPVPTAMEQAGRKITSKPVMKAIHLAEPDMTVKIMPRPSGKPPKIAKVTAPRTGQVLSHKIVAKDEENLYLRRAKHRRGPVFTRPVSLVVAN